MPQITNLTVHWGVKVMLSSADLEKQIRTKFSVCVCVGWAHTWIQTKMQMYSQHGTERQLLSGHNKLGQLLSLHLFACLITLVKLSSPLLQIPPPHPGPRGGGIPDWGRCGDPVTALPGPGVWVAFPACSAQPARCQLEAHRLGSALPAAERDPQASVWRSVPEGSAASTPIRVAAALPGGASRQVQLLLPWSPEPADNPDRHESSDCPYHTGLPWQDLLLYPQTRRQQRVSGVWQPRLRKLPGPRLPPPTLVPRSTEGRGAVPRSGIPAVRRASAHTLA